MNEDLQDKMEEWKEEGMKEEHLEAVLNFIHFLEDEEDDEPRSPEEITDELQEIVEEAASYIASVDSRLESPKKQASQELAEFLIFNNCETVTEGIGVLEGLKHARLSKKQDKEKMRQIEQFMRGGKR